MINVLGRRNPLGTLAAAVADDESEDSDAGSDSNLEESGEMPPTGPKQIKLKAKVIVRIQTIDDGKGNANRISKKKLGLVVERMKSRSLLSE